MKKLALLLALTGPSVLLGGCAGLKVVAEAPYQIVHQNALGVECASRAHVLVGTCQEKDLSDCAPNYPAVQECIRARHWSCGMVGPRLAMRMDPTLGVCRGN